MLLEQEATTIENEQLFLIMEAMFGTFAASQYIYEAENLVTKLKSEMEYEFEYTMFMERWCNLGSKYEKLTEKNSKLEKEHTTLQQNHEKLVAENNKLVKESKALHRDIKVKYPSKLKVRPGKVSP